MGNWSLPSLNHLYENFMMYLKERDDDAVRMNDSRVASASNLPEHAKRWNDTAKTLQNWASGAWSNLVLSVAGGGTGATTAAGARSALSVYSKAEVDAALAGGQVHHESVLKTTVALPIDVWTDISSVVLGPGTWLIVGSAIFYTPYYATNSAIGLRLAGTAIYKEAAARNYGDGPKNYIMNRTLDVVAIVPLAAESTVFLRGISSTGSSRVETGMYSTGNYQNIQAVKIA